jgi:hypothetical protein
MFQPKAVLSASLIALAGSPGLAQIIIPGGLVTVNVSNIAIVLADVLDVDVSQVPVTVQVPVGVAANVCDVSANVLAQQADDAAPCDAQSNSTALTRFVQSQLLP